MDKKVKKQALKRLAIAEGHIKKVRKMVEEEIYCPDVIHQSQAVQAALKKADGVILQGHLHTCVLKDIKGSKPKREKLIHELVSLYSKNGK